MRSAERLKMNVLEMKCLKNLVKATKMDRVRNAEVCKKSGIERELAMGMDPRVLRWFGR